MLNYSFFGILSVLGLIGLVQGGRAFLGYLGLAAEAEADYDYKAKEGMIADDLSKETYVSVYKRAHAPRAQAYMAAAIAAILILTGPAFMLLQFLLKQLWLAVDRSVVFEPGFLVWKFFLFFGIIGLWAGIVFFTASQFHKRAPQRFDIELKRAREQ